MAKKYLNGWQAPMFKVIIPAAPEETIELNLRFQAMSEFVEETYIEHNLFDGSIAEKFLYAHYYFELDYSALAEASELLKIKKILNYLQKGYTVRLFPHKEITGRYFFISTVRDRLRLGRHYGGMSSVGEKDFGITFRTLRPITNPGNAINWLEIGDGALPSQVEYSQYFYLADEEDNYLLDEKGMPIIASSD